MTQPTPARKPFYELQIRNIFANAKAGEDVTQLVKDALKVSEKTYWNGEPTSCRKVFVRMADTSEFPQFWGKDLLGKEVPAVEVSYFPDEPPFYLYDADGHGWAKVTVGQGGPNWGHKSVPVTDISSARERA